MDELMAFVHARLDEDDQLARMAAGAPWTADDVPGSIHVEAGAIAEHRHLRGLGFVGLVKHEPDRKHIARHDPARVLRDVQARRTTLIRCQEEMLSGIPRLVHFARMTVWEMAQRWNDHETFKEDWKP